MIWIRIKYDVYHYNLPKIRYISDHVITIYKLAVTFSHQKYENRKNNFITININKYLCIFSRKVCRKIHSHQWHPSTRWDAVMIRAFQSILFWPKTKVYVWIQRRESSGSDQFSTFFGGAPDPGSSPPKHLRTASWLSILLSDAALASATKNWFVHSAKKWPKAKWMRRAKNCFAMRLWSSIDFLWQKKSSPSKQFQPEKSRKKFSVV